VDSGLKLKSESAMAGEIDYADYKEHGGVMFPSVITVYNSQMPVTIKMTIVENTINPVFTDADWK